MPLSYFSGFLLAFGLLSAFPVSLLAQQHLHPQSSSSIKPQYPAGTIDGSKTPELIPDAVAYRLVLVAFAQPVGATPKQLALQHAQLAQFDLTEAEFSIFAAALQDFHAKYQVLLATQKSAMPAADQEAFRGSRDTLIADALAGLTLSLSQNAMTRFRAFVLSEKRRMTMAPLPVMAP